MHRFVRAVVVMSAVFLVCGRPADAAGRFPGGPTVDWDQHDTAVYVVSTLNVLHTRQGRPLVPILARRFHIATYEVWNDLSHPDLFLLMLKRPSGAAAVQFVYQMGWPTPLSFISTRFGIAGAPAVVVQEIRGDPKQLIGSFTSTLPR